MGSRHRLAVGLLLASLTSLASVTTGCAPAIRSATAEATKAAVPAAAEASLAAIEDPKLQARAADALGKPDTQRALQELSSGVTQGVVDGLSSDELANRLDVLVRRLTHAVLASVTDMMTPELQERTQQMASALASSIAGEVMRSAMKEFSSPEVQASLGVAARELAKQAVLGSNDALAELAEKRKEGDRAAAPLGTVGRFFATRTWLLVAIVTGLIFALPLLWLVRERRRDRRVKLESDRRRDRAAAILSAIEAGGEAGFSARTLALLRAQLLDEALPPGAAADAAVNEAKDGVPPSRRGGGMRPSAV
ncbi:MAG: hypothetical protein JWP97_658 [Labilithrix sp.]|nr:hypothetical protein [Labilithrix sp.]